MTETILSAIIGVLCGLLMWEKNENRKERSQLINAIIARTPEQYRDLELTDKVKSIEAPVKTEPDLIPENEIEDKKFEEIINESLGLS